MRPERIALTSADTREIVLARLREAVPAAFTDGRLDLDRLRELFAEEGGPETERYRLTWAGKRDALAVLRQPQTGTLLPVIDASIAPDDTRNAFVVGDNLECLKLLLRSYHKRIKLIYIDPPYNTGKDFIYPDDYRDPLARYLTVTGQRDGEGNYTTSNPETNGRFHSNWLSMMFPRLHLAREFLQEDGIIAVSIDDHEVHNLRMLMNEVFGEENFIAQLVWEKGRKNDAKLFSVGHEYIVVYARSKALLRQNGVVWREPKPGAQEIWDEYVRLRKELGNDDAAVEERLQDWYKSLPDGNPSKKLSRYRHVDRWGPWRDRDISWPGGGGPRYDVPHPVTGVPCAVPERGWGFATPEAMQRQIDLGLVVFRPDHTEPPIRKAHLRPVADELMENGDAEYDDEDSEEQEVGMQVMGSYIYRQSQVTARYLRDLFGVKVFDNPKDHEVLARLIRYMIPKDEPAIILDFFAGSGSTAEAVLQLNHQSGSKHQFIMVQLPEPTPEKSSARKAGYRTIVDVALDRLRRVIERLRPEARLDEDLGFRVYRLAESNFVQWKSGDGPEQLALLVDPLRAGWTILGVATEVALKEAGLGLSFKLTKALETPNSVFLVDDKERGQCFYLCLDDRFDLDTVAKLGLQNDTTLVVRDIALDDSGAANLASMCRLRVI